MGNALSMALRVRFRNLMDWGLRAAAAGKTLLPSRAIAALWGKKVRDGAPLEPLPSVPRKMHRVRYARRPARSRLVILDEAGHRPWENRNHHAQGTRWHRGKARRHTP